MQNARKKIYTERERNSTHISVPPYIEGATYIKTFMQQQPTPSPSVRWRACSEDEDGDDDEYSSDDDLCADDMEKLAKLIESVPYFLKQNDLLEKVFAELKGITGILHCLLNQETKETCTSNSPSSTTSQNQTSV